MGHRIGPAKLNGYTMQGLEAITSPASKEKPALALLSVLPLSAQIEISDTGLKEKEPATQNWDFSVPQDASIFLAGAYASHFGGFVQVTYAGTLRRGPGYFSRLPQSDRTRHQRTII